MTDRFPWPKFGYAEKSDVSVYCRGLCVATGDVCWRCYLGWHFVTDGCSVLTQNPYQKSKISGWQWLWFRAGWLYDHDLPRTFNFGTHFNIYFYILDVSKCSDYIAQKVLKCFQGPLLLAWVNFCISFTKKKKSRKPWACAINERSKS